MVLFVIGLACLVLAMLWAAGFCHLRPRRVG